MVATAAGFRGRRGGSTRWAHDAGSRSHRRLPGRPGGPRVIGGLVLAAGAGTRFGGSKQLAELDGRPLLEHAVRAMTAAPVGRVLVVLGAEAEDIAAGIDLHGAEPLVCARWQEGQSASLACGLAELAGCEAVVVTLGDQPRMSPDAIRRVIAHRGEGAVA